MIGGAGEGGSLALAKGSLRPHRTPASTLVIKSLTQMRLGDEEGARKTTREHMRLQAKMRVSA